MCQPLRLAVSRRVDVLELGVGLESGALGVVGKASSTTAMIDRSEHAIDGQPAELQPVRVRAEVRALLAVHELLDGFQYRSVPSNSVMGWPRHRAGCGGWVAGRLAGWVAGWLAGCAGLGGWVLCWVGWLGSVAVGVDQGREKNAERLVLHSLLQPVSVALL